MISVGFPVPFLAMCRRLGLRDPLDLLAVAANESSLRADAWNVGGKAAGLWQLTPTATRKAGWYPRLTEEFKGLSDVEQLPYWECYFRPHTGLLVSRAACYVSTYLPAGITIAGNQNALLCSKDCRTDIPVPHEYLARGGWPASQVLSWYTGNIGFDPKRTGEIRVHQLTEAIDRSAHALGQTWADAVKMVTDAQGYRGPEPVMATVHPEIEIIEDQSLLERLQGQ